MRRVLLAATALALLVASPACAQWTSGVANPNIPTTQMVVSTGTARPGDATAYAAGDFVSNSVTNTSVAPPTLTLPLVNNCSVDIPYLMLRLNSTGTGPGTGLDGAAITVRLLTALPTYATGDNGAYRLATNSDKIVGVFTCALSQYDTNAVGVCSPVHGLPFSVRFAGVPTLWWDMQAGAAFTPQASIVPTLTVIEKQDVCG